MSDIGKKGLNEPAVNRSSVSQSSVNELAINRVPVEQTANENEPVRDRKVLGQQDIGENLQPHDSYDDTNATRTFEKKISLPQITFRSTIAGLAIGSVVLVSNFQFGLQTGWVSMMSLPSALLGFAIFKLSPFAQDFTDVENVYIQSIAVAVGTGPLAYGLIGIVPAIEKFLTPEESGLNRALTFSLLDLFLWSLGLGLFGVFFAIPLRKQVIIQEKLPFPSGSATATLISVLHDTEVRDESESKSNHLEVYLSRTSEPDGKSYFSNIQALIATFSVSATYTLLSFFFPILKKLPVFGSHLSTHYQWNFQPSPAYIGQGIIMGLPTVSYMLLGAILGWGILAPLAKVMKWAPGEVDDWVNGGQGWILWISLSVMISDSLVSFVVVTYKSLSNVFTKMSPLYPEIHELEHQTLLDTDNSSNDDPTNSTYINKNNLETSSIKPDVHTDHLVSNKVALVGVIISSVICVVSVRMVFGSIVPYYTIILAIFLALLFSILGVRALGETDLNPVSGIGKLSQLIFAAIIPNNHPSKILINLVAGGIAEAGAQQAGDLMQDLKTGHLIGASPKAQFTAQIIGTIYSVFLSSIMYKVYNSVYEIPSEMFRIPTAIIWIDCSRLFTGEGLPAKAFEFSMVFGVIFGIISLLKNTVPKTSQYHKYLIFLPNGVAVGIGIYNSPSFTLARFLGGVISYSWIKYKIRNGESDSKIGMIIFSSGLVLGEGLLSGFTMLLTSMGVKHF